MNTRVKGVKHTGLRQCKCGKGVGPWADQNIKYPLRRCRLTALMCQYTSSITFNPTSPPPKQNIYSGPLLVRASTFINHNFDKVCSNFV